MKKLLLVLIFISGTHQLNAQPLQFKPADSLTTSINNVIKSQTGLWSYLKSDLKFTEVLASSYNQINNLDAYNEYFHNNLPVIVFDEISYMPVEPCYCYSYEPVKRLKLLNEYFMKRRVIPGLPVFKSPATLSPAPQK
jgi:hypothetical protein